MSRWARASAARADWRAPLRASASRPACWRALIAPSGGASWRGVPGLGCYERSRPRRAWPRPRRTPRVCRVRPGPERRSTSPRCSGRRRRAKWPRPSATAAFVLDGAHHQPVHAYDSGSHRDRRRRPEGGGGPILLRHDTGHVNRHAWVTGRRDPRGRPGNRAGLIGAASLSRTGTSGYEGPPELRHAVVDVPGTRANRLGGDRGPLRASLRGMLPGVARGDHRASALRLSPLSSCMRERAVPARRSTARRTFLARRSRLRFMSGLTMEAFFDARMCAMLRRQVRSARTALIVGAGLLDRSGTRTSWRMPTSPGGRRSCGPPGGEAGDTCVDNRSDPAG